jgi:polyisoprenoid-binding protein YceI
MRGFHPLSLAALGLTAVVIAPVAHAALSAPTDSRVGFQASGPAGMKIEGSTSDLSIADQGDNVVLTVPLGNLSTGIGLRDRHMKDKYLEVPKYPTAVLTVARSALKLPATDDKVEGDARSTATIHGQTRPVSVHYDAKRLGTALSVHGTFHINMRDFGIEVPTYLGVTVKPDVDVTAEFRVAGS